LSLKPTSAKVKDYYNALNQFGKLNISHEMAVRQAFASLLHSSAKPFGWKLVADFRIAVAKSKSVILDAGLNPPYFRAAPLCGLSTRLDVCGRSYLENFKDDIR
jgi:hypothetical protein